MLRVLALGFPLFAFAVTQLPGPAAAACDCKYNAMCPSGQFCKTNAILCAGSPMTGVCTRIVAVPQPDPVMKNPRRSTTLEGSGGMTAQ